MTKLINRILPAAKLPYTVCKGNLESRNKLAQAYSDKFVQKMNEYCPKGLLDVEGYKKCLNETIFPHKINFEVKPQDDIYAGSLVPVYKVVMKDDSNTCAVVHNTGYDIFLKLDDSGKYIKNKRTAVHETRHFFDHICNPKTNSMRCNEQYQADNRNVDEICFYMCDLSLLQLKNLGSPYKKGYIDKYKAEMADGLDKLSNPIAIELLQKIRYSLKTEINAYSDEIKYLEKGGFLNRLKNSLNIYLYKEYLHKQARFPEKLEIVTDMLKAVMQKERKVLHSANDL